MSPAVWACAALALCGTFVVVSTLYRLRHVAPDFGEYFERLDYMSDRERSFPSRSCPA